MTEYIEIGRGIARRQMVLDWFLNQDKSEIIGDYQKMIHDKLVAVGREDVRQAFATDEYERTSDQRLLVETVEEAAEAEFMTTLIDVMTTRVREIMLSRVRKGTGI